MEQVTAAAADYDSTVEAAARAVRRAAHLKCCSPASLDDIDALPLSTDDLAAGLEALRLLRPHLQAPPPPPGNVSDSAAPSQPPAQPAPGPSAARLPDPENPAPYLTKPRTAAEAELLSQRPWLTPVGRATTLAARRAGGR